MLGLHHRPALKLTMPEDPHLHYRASLWSFFMKYNIQKLNLLSEMEIPACQMDKIGNGWEWSISDFSETCPNERHIWDKIILKISAQIDSLFRRYAGPFMRFSIHVWQNAHVNNIRHAMACDLYFSFSKILQLC